MEMEGQVPKGLDRRIYTNRFGEAAKLDKNKEWLLAGVNFRDFLNKYPAVFKTGVFKIEGIYKDPNFPVQVNSDSQFRLFRKIYDNFYKEGEIINSKEVIFLYQQNILTNPKVGFRDTIFLCLRAT